MNFGCNTEGWNTLSQLQNLTVTSDRNSELAHVREILPISILQKLENTSEVPLRSLDLLYTELDVVATVLAASTKEIQKKPLDHLLHLLRSLHNAASQALDSTSRADIQRGIRKRSHRNGHSRISADEQIEHLDRCLEDVLKLQDNEKISTCGGELEEYTNAASRFIRFFTSCLLLFVPDRPFDPALRPMVEQKRHNNRKAELKAKLVALQDFEMVFSGQATSFRINLIEQDLRALGPEPEVLQVTRPQISELTQLQAEYNNILNDIVARSPDTATLHRTYEGQNPQSQETKLTRANIAQAVSRLSHNFHAYEDITKPLIAMLQGLDVGLALALLANARKDPIQDATKFICERTPFLGATPVSFINDSLADLQTTPTSRPDSRPHFLKRVAIIRSVSQLSEPSHQSTMFQAFHSHYEEWKEQLSQDQRHSAAQSSLYRYRGNEEVSDGMDEEDFRSLFPTSDNPSEEGLRQTKSEHGPRQQAQQLSQLHREIFQIDRPTSVRMLGLLRDASHCIAELWQDQSSMSTSPVPADRLLSALVLSLSEKKDSLHGKATDSHLYNFYTDANFLEAQNLINLVHRVQARFTELQEVWPEHATLTDVLKTSSELLALRNIEPVAKLLTKTEQLLGYLHEWQTVASKQYTAITLYDELTKLLVNWRRLELSTWARLLDMEDKKCYDDADAWWFIAYETIIAAPLALINNGEKVEGHTEHLFSTLSEFLTSTSMGQYTHRLGMIACFKSYLEALEQDVPAIRVVRNAIANFVNYYSHFNGPIRQFLLKGRESLEKDMKEVLLLASWKDTNINALRDSAKRSHHKLFKVVRKYRTLLSQPSEIVIRQGIPQQTKPSCTPTSKSQSTETLTTNSRAIQVCQDSLTNWWQKPERFTNAAATAWRMLSMSQLPSTKVDVTSILDHLGGNLINSMKALKRETPSKATKENEGLIKHLKARKRKLYADTLKMMRRMGFRSNINADALAKQSSLAVILTSCPVLGNGLGGDDGNAAEYHFQMILNLLPQAKERAKQHSEDLTHGEVVKSFGYLESMVSMILKQRAVLADAIIDLEDFTTAVKTVRNLWAPESYAVRKWDNQEAARADGMKYVLGWLPGIIEAGSVIIEKHGKLGATSHSTILDGLAIWRKRISAALEARDSLPDLPPTLTSSKHEQMITEEELLLQGFRADLQLLIDTNPDIDFVLTQIQMWTNPPIKDLDHQLGAEQIHDLKALDDSVSSSLDSILVTHQQMQEALLSMPTSDDDPEWLLQVEQSLTAGLKGLHVREISRILKDDMSKLHLMDCKGENDLYVAGALLAAAIPIIQQHRNVHHIALARYLRFHRSLCELASVLVTAFSEIVLSGFCSPSEAEGAESGNLEKLEGGTGLGEGEGAEDISKDVEDDEDISELAQQKGDDKKEEELEAQDEAVNMDHDDLEGETGENSDRGEDDGSANEDEGNDVDEQTGSVDNLDPSAVDEKLWDGNAEETEKEKSGSKSEGKAEKDENIAADSTAQQENGKNDESEDEDEVNEEGAEEGEEITNEESEKTDPHAREGQNLDLPEEIDLDNKDGNEEELESGDSEIDAMSAPDQEPDRDDTATEPDADQESDALDEIAEPRNAQADSLETDGESNDGEAVGSPVDTEPSDDQADDDQGLLKNRSDDATVDRDNSVPSDARGLGEDMDQQSDGEQEPANQAQARKGEKRSAFDQDDPEAVAKDGQSGPSKERSEENQTQEKPQAENSSTQALKRLGDALEKWHRQNKQIEDAADQDVYTQQPAKEMDMADQDFEHLRDDQVEADTQAMGAATDEQARALDHEALDSELPNNIRDFPPEDASPEEANDSDEVMEDIDTVRNDTETKQKQSWPSALVANNAEVRRMHDQRSAANAENEEDIKDLDLDLSSTHLQPADRATSRSAEEARNLWSHYESITRGLSFSLTEQLRLILAPTLATKMRGDFRTGKRLNIKRIIPYIASQYKRDKIWMRRSIPSKRNYQIMLAVDDSKSMGESGSGQLAFETLALVAKSLSMLEVGQICVVGFGNEVRVAHDFDKPFSSEAGAQIFQHFGFQQTKTNVRKLVADSIALFREARRKTFNAGTDLWQLELIISDGVCEDHDTIRRLVRQAQEERIMIVFVIVDALLKNESIMDMSQAVFEPDETGDTKLKIKRYLDDFPFPYYLVVGDVKDLPGVLAQALRQWFAEVVESG